MKIAKNTFVLSIIASLLIGFTGGIAFTNYNDAGAALLSNADSATIPAEVESIFNNAIKEASKAAATAIYADIQKNGGVPSTTPTSTPQAKYNGIFEKAMAATYAPSSTPSSGSVRCDSIYSNDAKKAFDSVNYSFFNDPPYCTKFQGKSTINYMVHEVQFTYPGGGTHKGLIVDMDVYQDGTLSWLLVDVLGRCHLKQMSTDPAWAIHDSFVFSSESTSYMVSPCQVKGLPGHPYCGDSVLLTNIIVTRTLCSGSFTNEYIWGSIDANKCERCKKSSSQPSASSTGTYSPTWR